MGCIAWLFWLAGRYDDIGPTRMCLLQSSESCDANGVISGNCPEVGVWTTRETKRNKEAKKKKTQFRRCFCCCALLPLSVLHVRGEIVCLQTDGHSGRRMPCRRACRVIARTRMRSDNPRSPDDCSSATVLGRCHAISAWDGRCSATDCMRARGRFLQTGDVSSRLRADLVRRRCDVLACHG